ncbi:MAG: zf-TFIIB domain-containing protein [Phycisphaeraceae bacterium]
MAKNIHRCPVCESSALDPCELAGGLDAWRCPTCEGNWIKGTAYFTWLKTSQPATSRDSDRLAPVAQDDSDAGKLCIDCGRYMRRVAVGGDVSFHLDRCTSCGGFWFDANEWAALKAVGLDREAHQVFTDSWQAEVRRQRREKADENRLSARLGAEGIAQLESLKRWVAEHPHGQEILAALTDPHNR